MSEVEEHVHVTESGQHPQTDHKVAVTVDHNLHHVYPGPYVVSTFKEIVRVPGSDILGRVVDGRAVAVDDSATITIAGGDVFISRLREHKVEVMLDGQRHHVFPGPYIVSTLKEILDVPKDKVLELAVSGEPEPLEETATVDVKGGETFLSREKTHTLKVVVKFVAATKPFENNHASRTETVGQLKARVLTAFGLSEGQQGSQTFTYTLYHGKVPLDNLSETLGQVAGQEHTLELKLNQQVTQG
jgi:hypothetical protein